MQFPSEIKKCVIFIGLQKANDQFQLLGTGFMVTDDINETNLTYIVTAKHIINGIENKGLDEVCLRINLKSGNSKWLKTEMKYWKLNTDENVDVAIFQSSGGADWDHLAYPLSSSMTENLIKTNHIDCGDDIFIVGLFNQHYGNFKNIPIVRIGNISAMPEEKIQTRNHLMDGYLIEAKSIGGLSGSPVFVNLGISRLIDGKLAFNKNGSGHLLLGLIYGHYDEKGNESEKINMGIGIVTPIEKIIETINQ